MGDKNKVKQSVWEDRKNALRWERYNPSKASEYLDYNNLVDLWSNDSAVKRFIHLDGTISEMFTGFLSSDTYEAEGFFYAFVDDDLAGVVYITAPCVDCEETNIDYIIVNPVMKGKGIGTRMVSSIKSNPTFFADTHKGTIVASVEHDNESSKRVFIKNGFKMYKPALSQQLANMGVFNVHNLCSKFGRWYFTERESEMDKDN